MNSETTVEVDETANTPAMQALINAEGHTVKLLDEEAREKRADRWKLEQGRLKKKRVEKSKRRRDDERARRRQARRKR